MNSVRHTITAMWVGLLALGAVGQVAGTSAGGLFSSVVCITPATLLALVLTPTATLSEAATAAVNSRFNNNNNGT